MVSRGPLRHKATNLNKSFNGTKVPSARVAPKVVNSRRGVVLTECCGVLAVFDSVKGEKPTSCSEGVVRKLCDRMGPRGPDGQGYGSGESQKWHWALGHQRLSIMDPTDAGNQPFVKPDIAVAANGEIYNFRKLYDLLPEPVDTQSDSDSEVLMHLYRAFGYKFVPKLDGMFAFVLVDQENGTYLAARDPTGIKPLYLGRTKTADGEKLMFASELKCLIDECDEIEEFPAGTYYTPETGYVNYYQPAFDNDEFEPNPEVTPKMIRDKLEEAVVKRMMSDVNYGLFLSGGIDSCIVGTLMKPNIPQGVVLPSFCVGMENSPDITAARQIAKDLGYEHNERIFTADEACSIIDKVIYHLETYNTELIRSSIPNFFLAEEASKQVKMCLTGEGSDEIFGGYVYFKDAPDPPAFQKELRRIYGALGNVNLKRADRMTMAHGLEARVPFLDVEFTALAMSLDPKYKMIGDTPAEREKAYLRNMFKGEIKEEVLWRQKAMQCEGVGEGWVSKLQRFCESQVSDQAFANAASRFPYDTPMSKEEYYYRDIFESYYPGLDRFTYVWEGGCRAGGAAWKSDAYTRFGLADVSNLTHGLQEKTSDGVGVPSALPAKSSKSTGRKFAGSTLPSMKNKSARSPPPAQALSDLDMFTQFSRTSYADATIEDMLLSGSDDRTVLGRISGKNSYHVSPTVMPNHLVRSSCTCNPLTPTASAAAEAVFPMVRSASPADFSDFMDKCVRGQISKVLQLPDGTGVITAPSGTDAELLPLMVAQTLFPDSASIRQIVTAVNEIGKGVGKAAKGEFSSSISPLEDTYIADPDTALGTEDLTSIVHARLLDARDAEGNYNEMASCINEEMDLGKKHNQPVIVHTVYGTKTNHREPFPEGTSCNDSDASVFVVVDACQGRFSLPELHEHLEKGAMIEITGSKFFSGPPFSGALLIPPQLMKRLQDAREEDIFMPAMMNHYFTQDDFPRELAAYRQKLPAVQNRGLAMRWAAALGEMHAFYRAGCHEEAGSRLMEQWNKDMVAEVSESHPLVDVFEANDSIINLTLKHGDNGRLMTTAQLRQVYFHMTRDITETLMSASCELTLDELTAAESLCLIGQPVFITEEFAILRIALGAPDVRRHMTGPNASEPLSLEVETKILNKLNLIAKYSHILIN
eukprot:CAMPEP_0197843936 /NCGR_PEP_ID=MMETSP1438-20131217/892_1 /TAXON_ID=1461541 /ORGANISM="Pterosperma sp., Strain CCMP1384" /LENGTH=1151 /DNA_ID=CAMNT_0043454417 /DNA_START=173 /DNA_END=3628 /DNA_ORIENTATION=-